MSIAITVTMSVPITIVVMSKIPRRGNQPIPDSCDRSICCRKWIASTSTARTMKMLMTIDASAAPRNRPRTVRSRRCRRALPFSEMPGGRAGVACAIGCEAPGGCV